MANDDRSMNLDAYKDRIIVGVGALLIGWLVYLTNGYMSLPPIISHDEMIRTVLDRSPYVMDKPLIHDRFERLWAEQQKIDAAQDKLVNELTALRVQVERLIVTLIEQKRYTDKKDEENKGEGFPY